MIIVKMWGGLGNQLFQYAFGIAMAKKSNTSVCFDMSFYDKQPRHVGRRHLDILKLNSKICKSDEHRGFIKFLENRYINKAIRVFPKFCLSYKGRGFVKETGHKFLPWLLGPNSFDNYYFDGYWQSEKYFVHERDTLLKLFNQYEQSDYCKQICAAEESSNSVAIHVRRGDYYNKKSIGYKVRESYYQEALEYLIEKVDNPTVFVFSDDIEWMKKQEYLQKHNCIFVENKSENAAIEDIICISKCKHGIMSSSTFSWWGNWLRNGADSIVIAPTGFYCNSDFIPERWIRL